MGWGDVFWGGLGLINTAANVSSAADVNKMRALADAQAQEAYRREQEEYRRAEFFDQIDSINRKIKKLSRQVDERPQSVYVICDMYSQAVKNMGITTDMMHPADRHILRDLYDNLDDLFDLARAKLSPQQREEADECITALRMLPELESTISLKESRKTLLEQAEQSKLVLASSNDEFKALEAYSEKPGKFKKYGITLTAIGGISTLFILPYIFGSGVASFGAVMGKFFLFLVWAGVIGAGIYLIIMGKNPYQNRFRELQLEREKAIVNINKANSGPPLNPNYASMTEDELRQKRNHYNTLITNIMGEMGKFSSMLGE